MKHLFDVVKVNEMSVEMMRKEEEEMERGLEDVPICLNASRWEGTINRTCPPTEEGGRYDNICRIRAVDRDFGT